MYKRQVKKSGFAKTIIVTHRPVVDDGWYEDFQKIFYDTDDYTYGSKGHGATIEDLLNIGKKFVYFASIQDLRGSSTVGGKFDKNDAVFSLDWDLVIVDEAHEGTTTALGDDVIKNLVKEGNGYDTKFLAPVSYTHLVEYIREVGNVVHKDTVQKYNVSINKHYTMQTAKPMKKPVNNTLQNSYSVNPTQAPTVKERKVPVVGVIVAATVLVLAVVLLVKILGK